MEMNLLKQLVIASGTSGDGQEVRELLYRIPHRKLKQCLIEMA